MKNEGKMVAFLGEGTALEGTLTFEGTVRLDGHFRGSIESTGTLIVGPTAVLESEIRVGSLLASGEIRGQITADERIEVHAPGRISGSLQAPTIAIAEGAVFEGETCMQRPAPLKKAQPEDADETPT